MEIILLKDVEHVGLANSIVEVKAGYARNYLIPQGLALVANKRNKNILTQQIRLQEDRATKLLDEAKELAARFTEVTLKIAAKAGTSGKIFGSVTNIQVAQVLNEVLNVELNRKSIKLPNDIKMLGEYTAHVTLHKDLTAPVKFVVFDDKPAEEA
jgi:large subunit ribosomal protein L9